MLVILNISKEAALFKVFNYLLSCFISVHTCILRIIVNYLCVLSKNVDNRQVMSFTNFKVVRVMGRGYFYDACTKLHINIAVGNYRNFAVQNRQAQSFADKFCIAFIFRVNGNRGIAGNRFRTGGGNG